jgi:hypothetical protein
MAMLGTGALAMWWDMAPEMRAEFEDWHSHEHFPERMSIPGFRRASRWMSVTGDDGVFVLYEVDSHAVLGSAPYAAHLNAPTPWSTRMMPHHRNMVRSQCRVVASHGGAVAAHALTLRFSAAPSRERDIRAHFDALGRSATSQPGLVGMHLLAHEDPALAPTTEQRIRALADRAADRVLVVHGYDAAILRSLLDSSLGSALRDLGVDAGYAAGLYRLSHSATPVDVA